MSHPLGQMPDPRWTACTLLVKRFFRHPSLALMRAIVLPVQLQLQLQACPGEGCAEVVGAHVDLRSFGAKFGFGAGNSDCWSVGFGVGEGKWRWWDLGFGGWHVDMTPKAQRIGGERRA